MPRKFESYRLSRMAEGDLADIYEYTVTHWSVDQANSYITDIRSAVTGLVEGTKGGRMRPDLPEGYLAHLVGSHLIIYRETKLILVARVLHASMDVARRLKP
jgi:toxin ParE1/3/4